MARFAAPDLTGLTAPDVVEELDYEDILVELKDDVTKRMAAMGVDYDVAMLESDPVVKVLEVAAYRETLLRARVNTAARAVMLAYAQENDLDQLGVYYGVERVPDEDDERLRERVQLAPEALSTAGPIGAYIFHAMAADDTVKSVAVVNPEPGKVHVYPLVMSGDGIPSYAVLEKIRKRLVQDDIRPLTDMVQVIAPTKKEYAISITLKIGDGPDPSIVKDAAVAKVKAYLESRHICGKTIHRSGIISAAHVSGVEAVTLTTPAQDVVPEANEVAIYSTMTVSVE